MIKLIAAAFIAVAAMAATACSQWNTPYKSLDDGGNTVSVKFLANGGMFANTNGVTVVDVFKADKNEITILKPDDEKRGNNAFSITKTGHFLAGWYVTEPATNANGDTIDEDGNPTKDSGKTPAQKITKRWDFDNDKLIIDPGKDYSSEEPMLTLTAIWIPYFNYEFYAKDEQGNFKLISTTSDISLEFPEWNKTTGQLNMKEYPTLDGKTFDSAYLDENCTQPITSSVTGEVDYEKGVAKNSTIKIYTEWIDGEWFKIYDAAQLYKNAKSSGNYIIAADLDFSKSIWPSACTNGKFKGKIYGEGHKITGINLVQSDQRATEGGLFGTIDAYAVIKDLCFSNVSYTVVGSLKSASFGLVAGKVDSAATVENISLLDCKLIFDQQLFTDPYFKKNLEEGEYDINVVFGEGNTDGIDFSGVSCEHKKNSSASSIQINVSPDGAVSFVLPTPPSE